MDKELREKYERLIDKYDVELHKLPALIKEGVDPEVMSEIYVSSIPGYYYSISDIKEAINKAISKNIERLRDLADAREQDILE